MHTKQNIIGTLINLNNTKFIGIQYLRQKKITKYFNYLYYMYHVYRHIIILYIICLWL